MKKTIASSLLCLASLTLAGTASATLFDFTAGNLGVDASHSYDTVGMTIDGIRVDVTAFTIENNGHGVISSSTQITGSGVGVFVGHHNNLGVQSSDDDGSSIDGGSTHNPSDPDEGLLFSFDQVVRLNYINFDNFGRGDDFNLTVDGTSLLHDFGAHSSSLLASSVPGQHDEFDFSNIIGSDFLFWADGSSDSFRIDRMIVSSVPEPTSLLLLGIGLVSFGLSRRKLSA